MSEVRLYVDEDAGENAVVQGLRARGVDVLGGEKGDSHQIRVIQAFCQSGSSSASPDLVAVTFSSANW